jgi:hypothetical protein
MPNTRESKKGAGHPDADVIIKDNAPDSQAALPPGTLKGPFLERQGDEQRQPSEKELRELSNIRSRQHGRRKE